jgi:hypothetical protein
MPSRIISQIIPTTVTSGTAFNITVGYETTEMGDLSLTVDDGFTISPGTYRFNASSPGSATFQITVTRTTAKSRGCTLRLAFGTVVKPGIDEVK